MVLIGLLLVLLALAVGAALILGTQADGVSTQEVSLSLFNAIDIDLNPLSLVLGGMATMFVFWLGLVLVREALARKARQRRERKEQEQRTQQQLAERDEALARERAEREREVHEQQLSTQAARERAEVAERDRAETLDRDRVGGTGSAPVYDDELDTRDGQVLDGDSTRTRPVVTDAPEGRVAPMRDRADDGLGGSSSERIDPR